MIDLVCVAGPTASGKTAFAVEIAKRINGEIISADSMQIYKYMDIGTAKATKEEMQGIRHYMIDEISPFDSFDAHSFVSLAKKYIAEIRGKNKIPIVAGGTGLYINSLTDNLEFFENNRDENLRNELYEAAEKNGNLYVHHMLEELDPESAAEIHPNNLKRVVRAIEACRTGGVKFSEQKRIARNSENPYNLIYFGLNTEDRAVLYGRIDKRVDLMFEKGLVREVKELIDMGLNESFNSMQGIGYKEVIGYLNGELTLQETKEAVKKASRRYAKRQLTWFKRDKRIQWIDFAKSIDYEEIVNIIIKKTLSGGI